MLITGFVFALRGVTGRLRAGILQSRSLQKGRDNTLKIHAETTLPPCSILPTCFLPHAACDAQKSQRTAAAGFARAATARVQGNPC